MAAPFSWKETSFSYRAKAAALPRVLEDIFITQQRPIDISSAVRELAPISGEFTESPYQMFNKILQSYGLVDYFDGTTMYVTTLSENKSVLRTLSNANPRDVERTARELGYLDRRFGLSSIGTSKSIKLSGPPAYIERISDVVFTVDANAKKQTDSSGARMQIRVIPLKHAWAEDITYNIGGRTTVIRGVANSLRQLVEGVAGPDGSAAAVRNSGIDTPGLPIAPDQRPASVLGALLGQKADDGGRGELKSPLPESIAIPNRPSDGDFRLGQRPGTLIRVVGDGRMNAVIIMAPQDILSMLENVVHELDVEPELVQIEAAIIDVEDGALKEIGFDWRLRGTRLDVQSTTSGSYAGQNFDNPTLARGLGPNLSIFAGSAALNFLTRIDALQTKRKASVLSRPKLATLNGSEAVLTNQEMLYSSVRGDRVAQLYQIDVGLQMRVVPMIVHRNDGSADIRLQIFIEDGSITDRRVGGDLPVTSKSAITTQAVVRNGESLLIGGYVRDTSESNEAKVPLLGDIPLVGALFRHRSANPTRQERLILITPKLLSGAAAVEVPREAGVSGSEQVSSIRSAANADVERMKGVAGEAGSITEEVISVPASGGNLSTEPVSQLLNGNRN